MADLEYWFGTKIRLLGLLTAGVQDLEMQNHHQYNIAATIPVLIKYLKPPSHLPFMSGSSGCKIDKPSVRSPNTRR